MNDFYLITLSADPSRLQMILQNQKERENPDTTERNGGSPIGFDKKYLTVLCEGTPNFKDRTREYNDRFCDIRNCENKEFERLK